LGYVWKRPRYVLDPDPELEKKTADPPHHPAAATPDRAAGRGRDRSAALPAAAGRLGVEGGAEGGPHLRPERPPGELRLDEPPDGDEDLPGQGTAAGR